MTVTIHVKEMQKAEKAEENNLRAETAYKKAISN
jgi:hypothetical protein